MARSGGKRVTGGEAKRSGVAWERGALVRPAGKYAAVAGAAAGFVGGTLVWFPVGGVAAAPVGAFLMGVAGLVAGSLGAVLPSGWSLGGWGFRGLMVLCAVPGPAVLWWRSGLGDYAGFGVPFVVVLVAFAACGLWAAERALDELHSA